MSIFDTIRSVISSTNALILFEKVNIGNVDYNTALREFDKTKNELQEIEETYATLCKVIKDYDFRRPE